jgi:hypothetical protein
MHIRLTFKILITEFIFFRQGSYKQKTVYLNLSSV